MKEGREAQSLLDFDMVMGLFVLVVLRAVAFVRGVVVIVLRATSNDGRRERSRDVETEGEQMHV